MTERKPSAGSLAYLLEKIELLGGFDAVAEHVADGRTMKEIAAMFGVTRGQMARAIDAVPDARQKLQDAKRLAVHGMVEDAFEAVQYAVPETAGTAKAEFDAALKLAAVFDKETFGEKKAGVTVNLNVNDLHLAAVKQVGAEMATARLLDPPAEEAEFRSLPADPTPAPPADEDLLT